MALRPLFCVQRPFLAYFEPDGETAFLAHFEPTRFFYLQGSNMTGNRCGHDPKNPNLSPAKPIRKGKGGLPRILSLAAERAKAWYYHPKKCKLLQSHPHRKTRSERREACQIVIETILSHLDLASLCLGTPTLENGFIDIDMRTIVRDSGIGQRRCERAIALLKEAGYEGAAAPRHQRPGRLCGSSGNPCCDHAIF